MGDRNAYVQPQVGSQGFARTMKAFGGAVSLLTTDLALNRTTGLFTVPRGFVVTGIDVTITDVDTNGTPLVQFSIGDSGSAARLFAASTLGQAGGTSATLAAAGKFYEFPAETEIIMTCTAAAATAAAGTLTVLLFGYIRT